jgi:hypothetical protein
VSSTSWRTSAKKKPKGDALPEVAAVPSAAGAAESPVHATVAHLLLSGIYFSESQRELQHAGSEIDGFVSYSVSDN